VSSPPPTASSEVTPSKANQSGPEKYAVLIAEDDPVTSVMLSRCVKNSGYLPVVAKDGEEALAKMQDDVHAVLLDLHMPKVSGMECLERIRKDFPDAKVIMVTACGEVNLAVEAMKLGALEYITKPFDPEELTILVQHAVEASKAAREHRGLKEVVGRSLPARSFLPKSADMRRLVEQVERVAALESTVLITGESGTGKTTVARMIHQQGPRSEGPFVSINCASLPRDLIEAELFGHAKGAFTGAVSDRPGRAEIADGGTLFLDEIGDLPLELQPKLLTFMQDRTFQRIGSNKEIKVDVRLISATHQQLEEMVDRRVFRQDLYYRLNVLSIDVPPVRERAADIPAICQKILGRISERRGTPAPQLSDDALQLMSEYHWPGNIREMENVLERATAFCDSETIQTNDLGIEVLQKSTEPAEATAQGTLAGLTLAEVEKRTIIETLAACGGNKAMTARTLGISEKSIYNKMRKHGLK